MIAALILAQAAVPVAPAPSSPDDEIVVIGQRLKRWAGRITSNPLFTHCRTTQSTGNAAIDGIGCRAMEVCWPDARRGIAQAQDKRLAVADRQRIRTETEAAFGNCTRTQRTTLIAALVAKGSVREGAYK